jgi:hypothetical protein
VRVAYAVETVDGETKGGIGISIQNPSASTAHVTGVSFVYPWRRRSLWDRLGHLVKYKRLPLRIGWCHTGLSNFDLNDGCPSSIEPAKSHWIFVPKEVVEQLLSDAYERRFVVQVQDALWRNKYSKPFAYPAKSN